MSAFATLLTMLEKLEGEKLPADQVLAQLKEVCQDMHALESMSPMHGSKRMRSLSVFDKEFDKMVESPAGESDVPLFQPQNEHIQKGRLTDLQILSRYRSMEANLAQMRVKHQAKQIPDKVFHMNRGRLTKRMRELDQEWFLRKGERIEPDTK